MFNTISDKFLGMQNDLLSLNDLLRRQQNSKTFFSNITEKAKRLFIPSYAKTQINSVANKILNQLENSNNETSLKLADAFIRCYERSWYGREISQVFDRAVSTFRPEKQFLHKDNQVKFDKWVRSGQDPDIYHRHPEFSSFMEESGLLSQIKITQDSFEEINGEPALKVNGEWMQWSTFKDQFNFVYSRRYREIFVIGKDNQVYTYLDNGKGLQVHHPYLNNKTPISTLSEKNYEKVLEKARTFVREEEKLLTQEQRDENNEKRTFVLQLVSSHEINGNTRLHELLVNSKHPYLRLIIGQDNRDANMSKGEVYEVGFWPKKNNYNATAYYHQGRFRSPDMYEYKPAGERIVTNMAITPEEAQAFSNFVTEYHNSEVNIGNPIGFHYFNQNCSTFTRVALESANITVPTKITLAELLPKITPLWGLKIGKSICSLASKVFYVIKNPLESLPHCIQTPIKKTALKIIGKCRNLLDMLSAVVFIPLKLALGEAFGSGGRAFVQLGEKPKFIEPSFTNFKNWFTLSNYTVNVPGVLQKWQREQASTEIYKNPVRLCIVPKDHQTERPASDQRR